MSRSLGREGGRERCALDSRAMRESANKATLTLGRNACAQIAGWNLNNCRHEWSMLNSILTPYPRRGAPSTLTHRREISPCPRTHSTPLYSNQHHIHTHTHTHTCVCVCVCVCVCGTQIRFNTSFLRKSNFTPCSQRAAAHANYFHRVDLSSSIRPLVLDCAELNCWT